MNASELPSENKQEESVKICLEKLNFEELQEVCKKTKELAEKTFKEKEAGNGFENVNGSNITIDKNINGRWEIINISENLEKINFYTDQKNLHILKFDTKQELMQEIRKMIEETGNRIIE